MEDNESPKKLINASMGLFLEGLQLWMDVPMLFLALAWLGLFVVEMVWGLTPLLLDSHS